MKTFCLDSHTDWDNVVRMLLLAERETCQESLGFTHKSKTKIVKALVIVFALILLSGMASGKRVEAHSKLCMH
jgi:hypothetical protein